MNPQNKMEFLAAIIENGGVCPKLNKEERVYNEYDCRLDNISIPNECLLLPNNTECSITTCPVLRDIKALTEMKKKEFFDKCNERYSDIYNEDGSYKDEESLVDCINRERD